LRSSCEELTLRYQYSYPFLPQYHADGATDKSKSSLLVTDGSGVLNLYRDIFFIPDPTLAFLGLSVNVSAFSCFEYQALAAAHVFAQQARIPDKAALREAYDNMVATKGEGKFSHYLGREGERIYVAETVKWLNDHADKFGGKHIKGHSEAWIAAQQNLPTFLAEKYGLDPAIMAGLAEAKPVPPSS
jgi:hypothetical protein